MNAFATAVAEIGRQSLALWLDAAPWLVLGLLAAGVMRALVPAHQIARWLGGRGPWPIVRAAIIGTPLPLCSCSVLPAAITIRRRGASRGATVSFLIATPENGLDSLALSYALLGGGITVARVIGALTGAVVAGLLTELFGESHGTGAEDSSGSAVSGSAGLGSAAFGSSVAEKMSTEASGTAAMGSKTMGAPPMVSAPLAQASQSLQILTSGPVPRSVPAPSLGSSTALAGRTGGQSGEVINGRGPAGADHESGSRRSEVTAGLYFAFTKLLGDLIGWLALGVVMAAAVQVLVPADWLAQHGSGPAAKILMLVVGVPMYICASASTPFAAGLIASGVSSGTALVLLLAGPATNLGSVAIVRRELGWRAVAGYLLGIASSSLVLGFVVDAFWPDLGPSFREHVHAHDHTGSLVWQVFAWASALLLAAAGLRKLFLLLPSRLPATPPASSRIQPAPPAQHSP